MGYARWNPGDWDDYAASASTKTFDQLFDHRSIDAELDPLKFSFRESCDSASNPHSTPIIVAIDQTGSMGMLAETLIRKGLGTLIEEIYDRKPVADPHVMLMAVGDAWFDRAPLQATQFEADISLANQLTKFFIEGGGGGNNCESYNLPWYFAATRTKCDAIDKRGQKGYLFTVGDEPPPPQLLASHVEKFLGGGLQQDMKTRDLFTLVSKNWNVFHIMIEEGSFYRGQGDKTKKSWRDLIGENAIGLADHTKLAELIVSILEVQEGKDPDEVAKTWKGSTALTVRKSIQKLGKKHHPLSIKGLIRL
ncbi:MAG TPA: hypothetical protein V6C76_07505 [Drouetiella sp.]